MLTAADKCTAELEKQLAALQTDRFGLERLAYNDGKIQFYTGFHSYQCLHVFFDCVVPYTASRQTWAQVQRLSISSQCRAFHRKLPPFE